jgi:enoyl-CoA hydratase
MKSYETLDVAEPADYVLRVTLNRSQSLNALNTQMGEDLVACFEALAMDHRALRCIILTGTGDKAFCAGGDLKQRDGMTDAQWRLQHLVFERMVRAILACPLPLVGAVNGVAFGGGCEIALCCDFLYAADHSRFALPEVKLGIMPGGGGTQTLPRSVGERRAKELILTGRPFSAAEALEWGMVNAVCTASELDERTLAVAGEISRNAPASIRQAKQSIARGLQMSLADGLAFEIESYNRLVPTQDRLEGVRAFNEKRPPRFEDR